jgi:hypothetical protein
LSESTEVQEELTKIRETQCALEASLRSVVQIQETQAALEVSLQNVSKMQEAQIALEAIVQSTSQRLTADIEGLKASQNYLYRDLARELEDLREETIVTVPIKVNEDSEKAEV